MLTQQESKRGTLIAFEGPNGSGKTTQRKLFKTWLESEGQRVVATKWASSPLVKPLIKVRQAVHAMSPEENSLLHAADFRQLLETEVLPALWAGKHVLADQYLFTALASDSARGLDLTWVTNAYAPLFWPDMVFYFSVSAQTSSKRVAGTRAPKYYEAGQDVTDVADPLESYRRFVGNVIKQYEGLSTVFQFITIDAEQSIFDQHHAIRERYLKVQRRPWTEFNAEALKEWLVRQPQFAGQIHGA